MDVMNLIESLFRWFHVVFGILWVGLLYFFNWVNSSFTESLDTETRKKVVPELMPRALYWFRWGAAWTWITGFLLIALVYYHTGLVYDEVGVWTPAGIVLVALTWLGVFIYDVLFRAIARGPAQFIVGWVLASAAVLLFKYVGGFSFRGYNIHLGAMFGTIMAFNVWFRIWPAQQKILRAVKNDETPDASQLALAGMRSQHNTYMSIPLVYTMIGQHAVGWAPRSPLVLCGVILFGWWVTGMMYRRSKKLRGL
jgi:uncharacterized membrane protein